MARVRLGAYGILISDECTNEVKDPNMTPRAYRLRGSQHFSCLAAQT